MKNLVFLSNNKMNSKQVLFGFTVVVVAGKNGVLVAERENLVVNGVVEAFGGALLKVGASATAYEQRVAREHDLGRVAHE